MYKTIACDPNFCLLFQHSRSLLCKLPVISTSNKANPVLNPFIFFQFEHLVLIRVHYLINSVAEMDNAELNTDSSIM